MTIGNEYILYDDRGLKVDYYLSLLNDFENIGVMVSGGPDSAFTFYWLAKCIHENNLDHTILPMTGWEMSANYQPYKEVDYIINFVKNEFPNSNILDHYTYNYPKNVVWKEVHEKHKVDFVESGLIDHYINGVVAAPLFDDVYLGELITGRRDVNKRQRALRERRGPFQQVDKKFIAYQYKKYNLMDNLYPHTVSCVNNHKDGSPCKVCWWCKERWWAFGTFDRGVTGQAPRLRTKKEMWDIQYYNKKQ